MNTPSSLGSDPENENLRFGVNGNPPVLVAIPVRDEAEEIRPCLLALAGQQGAGIDAVVVCLNNCRDETADVVAQIRAHLPFPVHSIEVALPDSCASAGLARRIAMESAAKLAGYDGVLLTTDADARVGADWLAANLSALAEGADAVAGRAVIEPEGAKLIPAHLHAIDARECAYAELLDEICTLLDPDPADPWPRHVEENGASIAVTVAAYRRAGGMPIVPLGEDRAFFDALRRVDARVRHAPTVGVIVSARIKGRAHGGMADTMRRRLRKPDPFLDDRLEPAATAFRRACLRRRLREARSTARPDLVQAVGARLGLDSAHLLRMLATAHFGAAWAAVEAASPALRNRALVALEALPAEFARALWIRDRLKPRADQGGTALLAAAE